MAKAYRIELAGADINGQKKAVLFAHGIGLLSDQTHLEQYRSHYNCSADGKWTFRAGPTVEDYRAYWEKMGAKIAELKAEDAETLYDKLTKRPSEFAPKPANSVADESAKKSELAKKGAAEKSGDDEPAEPPKLGKGKK